jgi:HAD superfamily hydrolase (TIGR01509 family)
LYDPRIGDLGVIAGGLALVFDLDGVIVDSMPLHTEAWRVYLNGLGIACSDIERRMHGRRNDEIVADFIGSDIDPAVAFEHGARKERLYREMMRAGLQDRLVRGVTSFLARHENTPKALASNAEPANVDFVLDGAQLRGYFKVIVDGTQVRRPKPAPDVYLCAADKLNVAAANCIVFEDSPAGVQAARASGARVVGVETHAALQGVDFRVPHFADQVLEGWLEAQQACG